MFESVRCIQGEGVGIAPSPCVKNRTRKTRLSEPCNDNDSDHSFSQLSVHNALTCSEGQSAWALAPSLFGEKKKRNSSARIVRQGTPARTSCHVDKQCRVRGILGGGQCEECGQRLKCFSCAKEHLPPFVVKQCFANRCRSLESIHPMKSPVRFRNLLPHPHKSVVVAHMFDNVNNTRR